MNYFGARYYDSDLGRWTSVDPLADKYPGWSPYNYTMNNPLNATDPDGRGVNFLVGAFIGAATDLAFQMVVEGKSFSDVDYGSVGISATAGAIGVGIAGKAGQLGKFLSKYGDELLDASASVAGQLNENGEVSISNVLVDVAAGKAVSKFVSTKSAGNIKQAEVEVHRKQHTAQNNQNKRSTASQRRKDTNLGKAKENLQNAHAKAAGASVAASNVASKSLEKIRDEKDK